MMTTSTPAAACAPALTQKQRRALLKKERRRRKRQALAQARECGLQDGSDHTSEEEDDDDAEKERQRLHEEWLERERLAQEEFKVKSEREEAARRRKEEEERRIKEEWDAQQKREQEEKDQRRREKQDREEAVQKMLDQAENQLDNGGPWMNPEAPVTESSENYGTERDVANCPFFLKTGACRFGDRCSRRHVHPSSSSTLMIRGMFVTFGMEQCHRDDYDTDACLEHSEEELQEYFLDFYHDVLPEFKSVGKVVQFKVSCNFEQHLRGNVYVQFDTEEQCRDAFVRFNGRWYAGRQLHCELCPITRWKNAICGLFDRQKCPKGKHCNFLHVFRNPGNEFWEADRDLHLSPDRDGRGPHKAGWHSERSWRLRKSSRSPLRSERSRDRRSDRRSRSRSRERSRERRASQYHRGDCRSSRSRPTGWRKDRYRSRSRDKDSERDRSRSRSRDRMRDRSRSRSRDRMRDRSRSRSRDREQDRLHNRSKDKEREHDKCRSRSKENDRPRSRSSDKDAKTETHPGVDRDRSRSRSGERERKRQSRERNKNRSPKKTDSKDKTSNDDTHTHRHHKHSKKSKKKSKKKHKRKSYSPEGTISSGESEKEEETGDKNVSATSPSVETIESKLDPEC
ncbi:U2 small nuclear ribonucleoprotein auxiliary factor 35 kDa subunit-related protein 2 isoform X1 [Myripristis murdjan]|uniref:Zinc finger CCCH-type, RNA binding motif and serine/arginine rich 2 n=1 Tax=Myripristis murdjan TaxID=586833 RepID=A0A667WZC2_9TELE|nr:U2 small nuclear ribonucleoprotein auxiliary factor 35 kDa subunit-related protein 2 isoform X1 [Myripristis murdjan]